MRTIIGTLLVGASALAFCGAASAGDTTTGAKEYAPGQAKPDASSGKDYAPGQTKGEDESAKGYAPGQRATGSSEPKGMHKGTEPSHPHGSKR